MNAEDKLFALHAEVCRTLGHPIRLKLVYLLGQGERSPGELASLLGVSAANLSQHLAALRSVGVVEAQRQGSRVRYRLTSGEVAQACDLMRRVLLERLERESRLLGVATAAGKPADLDRRGVGRRGGRADAEDGGSPGRRRGRSGSRP